MRKIQRNGVGLAYVEFGEGHPPIVFVHGWCCDHTFLEPQLAYFERRHRVIGVDLRGHGASDAPEGAYTMPGFAEDISWLCGQLQLKNPIVVGHSMGGNVALELAALELKKKKSGNEPAAIVLIDSLVLPPESFIVEKQLRETAEGLRGDNYLELFKAAVSAFLFIDTDDQARKKDIIQKMSKTSQHVMRSAFENHVTKYNGIDAVRAVGGAGIPTAIIVDDEPFVPLEPFRSACRQLKTGQTLGWGHFSPLFAPDQVNPMIERFLATQL